MDLLRRSLPPLLILALAQGPLPSQVLLSREGRALAGIVTAPGASAPVRHAAAELARFLGEVTGGKFNVSQKLEGDGPALLVGPRAARAADPQFTTEGLGEEGIVIRTQGNRILLAGGEPRGTLYAVYTFLEDYVGCRWWTPKASTIPKKPTLRVPFLDVRYVPIFEYRSSNWREAFDPDWAVRNKMNGIGSRLDATRGGMIRYEGFVHTFYRLIPPGKYFKIHPDWFAMIGGKRVWKRAQLCLTNEEMRKELEKNLAARLRKDPSARIASISQNDWHGRCRCPKCAALEKKEGSPAGPLIWFVNQVAADLEKEFPKVAFDTLAYQYTRKPPLHVRPRPNVIVRLCSIECSFARPLSDPINKKFLRDLQGWSKICNRLYIWDYVTDFRHYLLPLPNIPVLGPNLALFAKNHVKGVFEEGAYDTAGAEMAPLKNWVLAKLLWNPFLDSKALVREFLDGYYGPAGREIGKWLDLLNGAAARVKGKIGCFTPPEAPYLSFRVLAGGWKHMKAAEKAAAGSPAFLRRVQAAQAPLLYTVILKWKTFRRKARRTKRPWPFPPTPRKALELFMSAAKKGGVTRIRESRPGFQALEEAVQAAEKSGKKT